MNLHFKKQTNTLYTYLFCVTVLYKAALNLIFWGPTPAMGVFEWAQFRASLCVSI